MGGPLMKLIQGESMINVAISFFAVAVIIFVVFPIHECAHGFAAKLLGDDTAQRSGRLTLNPLAHIDWMGALMMLFFPIGWAKPVPVNPQRCTKVRAKTAMALTAAAGPVSNILLGYIFFIISKIVSYAVSGSLEAGSGMIYLPLAFYYIAMLNVYLAVLNLFPVPPLDGSKILFFFLKPRWAFTVMRYQQQISLVFMILLFATGLITGIIGFFADGIISAFGFLSGFIDVIMR